MTQGTKQWADSNVNFLYGCFNDCKYCYAACMALRFGRIQKREDWAQVRINAKAVKKGYRKRQGRIMFPTSHDLFPIYYREATFILDKLLQAGNEVLVTTKPNFEVIRYLCHRYNHERFEDVKTQIQFRFTITSIDDQVSLFWEPQAPRPDHRLKALKLAYELGFKTSLSVEPFLDPVEKIPHLITHSQPYVNESIWIGPMNKRFCPKELWDENKWGVAALKRLHELIWNISPKLRYKDSLSEAILFGSVEKP